MMFMTIDELLQYTDEERARWEQWLQAHGDELLAIPITGERETSVGKLIMHIFGPELRFVERLRNEAMTSYRSLPVSSVETVFGFGLESRRRMREYIDGLGAEDWPSVVELQIGNEIVRASVRKIVLHTLLHEVRHWAQIARIFREHGIAPPGRHDLLMSGALE